MMINIIIYRRKVFFERKRFNLVVGAFFSFPETAHDAQTFRVRRVVGVLYNSNVVCHRGSQAGGSGFEFRYRPYF